LRGSRDGDVVAVITTQLGTVASTLVTAEQLPRFRNWVAELSRPILAETAWNAAPGDSTTRRQLRRSAITMLGEIARDEEAGRQARMIVEEAIAGQSSRDPSIVAQGAAIAARTGDAALFEKYALRLTSARTPVEYSIYLDALGDFVDPSLVRRAIDLALSPQVRSQDAPRLLFGAFANPDTNATAWAYLKQHWSDVENKVSGPTLVGAAGATGSFCDPAMRQDVVDFFAAHKIAGAERRLRQALERIDSCIELKAAQTKSLQAWLSAHDAAPAAN
jgi:aminopeptidase N